MIDYIIFFLEVFFSTLFPYPSIKLESLGVNDFIILFAKIVEHLYYFRLFIFYISISWFNMNIYDKIIRYKSLSVAISRIALIPTFLGIYFYIMRNEEVANIFLVLTFCQFPLIYLIFLKEKYLDKDNQTIKKND